MNKNMKVLGFGGSLRKGSYSMALLQASAKLAPNGMEIEIFNRLGEFPPYNKDMDDNPPKVVTDFKEKVKNADAILISTPEYNYSIPGFLKNAIDWGSRPYGHNSFEGKPVALLSSSTGSLGGSRAQYHLRQCCVFLNMYPINRPECFVGDVQKKVDDSGRLTDQGTQEKIKEVLEALAEWTKRLASGRGGSA